MYRGFKNKIKRKENIYFFNQDDFSLNPQQSINQLFDWLDEKCTDKIIGKVKNLNFGQENDIKEPKNMFNTIWFTINLFQTNIISQF